MVTEEAAFLERICSEPEEDAPRLIFADWLDDRRDSRGHFIRVQIALSRMPIDAPGREQLQNREATLLSRHQAKWSAPLRGIACSTEFSRGFIDTVNVEGRVFLRRHDELFRLAPIRNIRFLDVGSSLAKLMNCPDLARLAGITISSQHIDEQLTRALVESPHLGGLNRLHVGRNRIGDRGAERLAWSPRFRNLRELNLSDNAIGDVGSHALAESSNLASLESLELRRNELSRVGLADLCGTESLVRLSYLGLALNYVGAIRETREARPSKSSLRILDLSENGLTPEGFGMLTGLAGLGKLNRLVLERNEVGNEGASLLANWSNAASLQSLALSGNRIGDEGARAIAHSTYLHQLLDLDLSDNPIHDSGALAFLNPTNLPRLNRIGLPYLGLTPQVRRALARQYPG